MQTKTIAFDDAGQCDQEVFVATIEYRLHHQHNVIKYMSR